MCRIHCRVLSPLRQLVACPVQSSCARRVPYCRSVRERCVLPSSKASKLPAAIVALRAVPLIVFGCDFFVRQCAPTPQLPRRPPRGPLRARVRPSPPDVALTLRAPLAPCADSQTPTRCVRSLLSRVASAVTRSAPSSGRSSRTSTASVDIRGITTAYRGTSPQPTPGRAWPALSRRGVPCMDTE